jgi:hypothetical protein
MQKLRDRAIPFRAVSELHDATGVESVGLKCTASVDDGQAGRPL